MFAYTLLCLSVSGVGIGQMPSPPHPSLHLKRFTETNEAVIRRRYFSQFPLPLIAAGFVEIVFPVDSKAPAADSISYDANF